MPHDRPQRETWLGSMLRVAGSRPVSQGNVDGPKSRVEVDVSSAAASPRRSSATVATLAGTLGLAAACWVIVLGQLRETDMETGTQPGSLVSFLALWAVMMAAMMLPGAIPAVLRTLRVAGVWAVPVFLGSYLAVWVAAGMVVYTQYWPHGAPLAGALVIVAGGYQLTPLQRACRRRCVQAVGSGFTFGVNCLGASAGLMAVLLALGVMSLAGMSVTTVLVCAQKLLPAKAAVDVALAGALVALGALILLSPTAVHGLIPPR